MVNDRQITISAAGSRTADLWPARLHRQGQQAPVIVHHLVVQDARDEDVMTALQDKGDVQESLLQSLKARMIAARAGEEGAA